MSPLRFSKLKKKFDFVVSRFHKKEAKGGLGWSEACLVALAIGFGHFFYVTHAREDWNTSEDGYEHTCVLFKNTRVFSPKREGNRSNVTVGQTLALALSGTLVRKQSPYIVKL